MIASCPRPTAAVLVGCLALASPVARGQSDRAEPPRGLVAEARRQIAEGRRLYAELDFAAAVDALRRALSVPGLAEAERLEAYELLGSAYVALDQEAQAREAFLAMLAIDPYHVVREPSGSPKITRLVEQLRRQVAPDAALDPDVVLRPRLPRRAREGHDVLVRFEVVGPRRPASVRLWLRGVEEMHYARIDAEPDETGAFVARIPSRRAPDELELYAEARDEAGRLLTRAGEPYAPLSLRIVPSTRDEPATPFQRWWFWAAIAGVLGAGAAAVVLASPRERAAAGDLPPGRVQLP
ncbi:MAG: hypothetical protein NZ898_07880 [Myxococcota bacterium]|nr:hypothetical protein [Myxococcota bacterium]MDW8362013.1 hypothetical protein [Myxococcales bacterium]